MGILDLIVYVAFVGAIAAVAIWSALDRTNVLSFLAAGRSLSLPAFVVTLVSTWYGGVLGIGETVSVYGLGTWVLMGFPYYVFALIYAFFYAEKVREADQISLAERLGAVFGKGPALVGGGLVFLLGVPAAHILMLSIMLTAILPGVFGQLPTWVVILAAGGIASLCVMKGGLVADVRVSTIAFGLMYLGFGVLAAWCLVHHPLPAAWQAIPNKALLTWDGGAGPLAVISFFLLGAWTLIDPGFHQRTASASSPKAAKRGILASVVCWMVFDLLTITAGMYAVALASKTGSFPALADKVLPDGLRGLFLVGITGTVLSALVGYALVSGAGFGRDLICRLNPRLDELKWTRIGIAASLLTAALIASQIQSVLTLWYSWGGCIIGALLLSVTRSYGLLKFLPDSPTPHVWGMAAGFIVSLGWLIYGLSSGNPYLTVTLPGGMFGYTLPEALSGASFGLGTLVPSLAASGAAMGISAFILRKKGQS